MLKRLVMAVLAGLALLSVAAVEVAPFVPLEAEVCSQNEQTHEEHCTVQNVARVWIGVLGERLNYYSPAITTIATIAIAAFTLTLWRSTTEHGRLMGDSFNLARDEFNAKHRPRLEVRFVRGVGMPWK
jgi:hypothetical protein